MSTKSAAFQGWYRHITLSMFALAFLAALRANGEENGLKKSPLPRFERNGLLDLSEDSQNFIVNPALLAAFTPSLKHELRSLAIQRIAEHFEEDEASIEVMVTKAIG